MKNYRITLESFLYLLAFLLALWLRLVALGERPLSDYEADLALQALQLSTGHAPVVIGPQPGYVLLTAFIFWLVGASNFAARLLPALTGALLVFLPFLLSKKLFPPLNVRNGSGASVITPPPDGDELEIKTYPSFVPGEESGESSFSPLSFMREESRSKSLSLNALGGLGPIPGRLGLLVFAFALVIEPGLLALSRQAGSPILAVSLSLLALALAWLNKPILAGIMAGLALLMGPTIFHGALGLALAWGMAKLLGRSGALAPLEPAASLSAETWDNPPRPDGSNLPNGAAVYRLKSEGNLKPHSRFWRLFLFSASLTILLVGTYLFRYPSGLSSWAGSLLAYLQGWAPSAQVGSEWVPALRLLVALPIYTPLALIFGLLGLVTIWIKPDLLDPGYGLLQHASLWLVAAFSLAVIYPARSMGDLAWALIPLSLLAAYQLARLLRMGSTVEAQPAWLSILHAILIFVLFALFWLNLAGLAGSPAGSQAFTLRLGVMFGVIALGVLATALVGLGWSWGIAARGSVLGLCLVLGSATIAAAWGAAGLRNEHTSLAGAIVTHELWSVGPETVPSDGFLETLSDLGGWKTGWPRDLEIALAVDSPSLQWVLREFPKVDALGAPETNLRALDEAPAVVITNEGAEAPSLAAAYRGQDFAWRIFPAWSGVLPPDFFRWLAFREAPARIERVILWARSDLFPGGQIQGAEPSEFPAETP